MIEFVKNVSDLLVPSSLIPVLAFQFVEFKSDDCTKVQLVQLDGQKTLRPPVVFLTFNIGTLVDMATEFEVELEQIKSGWPSMFRSAAAKQ